MRKDTRAVLGSIAANLRELRIDKGWTQEKLAEHGGFKLRYLQDVERGKVNLSIDLLVRLARTLSIEPDVLLKKAQLAPAQPGRPRNAKPPVKGRK